MTSDELYEAFREDVSDTRKPYLWSDTEVWRYMSDANTMFVRLTGGIADFTSEASEIDVTVGEATAPLHPSILRIMQAKRRSDNGVVEVINTTDLTASRVTDYGGLKQLLNDDTPGPVHRMVVGAQDGLVRWIHVPLADDTVDMVVHRLPLQRVTGPGQQLYEINEIHHIHLIDWMKHLAYKKQDVETFNAQISMTSRANFEAYCRQVTAEGERIKHKTRVVAYGGL